MEEERVAMPLRHEYQDALTVHVLDETLRHRITVETPIGPNESGELIFDTPQYGVRCFITNTMRRILTPQGLQVPATWEVLFDRAAILHVGTRLSNGIDRDGDALLGSAIVASLNKETSPERGVEAQATLCTPE